MAAHDHLGRQFIPPDSSWVFRFAPEPIDKAINSYSERIPEVSAGETKAPYDAASMAEIYHPRVRRLMDLQSQGHTHAAWGRLATSKDNTWHAMPADSPAIKNPATTTHGSNKLWAKWSN